MPTFHYEALDKKGKRISGSVAARSPDEAIESLRKQGIFTTAIRDPAGGRRPGLLERLRRIAPGTRSG